MILHDCENTFRVEEIYAYISEDEFGNNGILAVDNCPLVFGDISKVEKIRLYVNEVKKLTDKKIKLIRYSNREVIEEL